MVASALGKCRDSPAFQGENHWYVRVSLFVPEGYPSRHLPTGDPMVDKMQSGFILLVRAVYNPCIRSFLFMAVIIYQQRHHHGGTDMVRMQLLHIPS